jgi:hypothetical protein
MAGKAVVSLTTGLEDSERVTVAFLVATGVACEGCPPLAELADRYAKAGGRYLVWPICFDARNLDKDQLVETAELGGTVPMWQWIGDDGATTFSY